MGEERLEIQKRHTLNWLIQGSSQHAGMTLHHLVRDELNALDERLLRGYDQFALLGLLQYWRGTSVLVSGWPPWFWWRAASKPSHPFFGHPLLVPYGGMLARAAKERAVARCKGKGIAALPIAFSYQIVSVFDRLRRLEAPYRYELEQLAKQTAVAVWGIGEERLKAELSVQRVLSGADFPEGNSQAEFLRRCVVGASGVVRRRDQLMVMAKGSTWQVLAKELVKGTAELVCLHGLRELDPMTYHKVIQATDRIDLEPWLLQSGGELWRRLLAVLPDGCTVSRVLMNLALLPAEELHAVLEAVIRESADAGRRLGRLGG